MSKLLFILFILSFSIPIFGQSARTDWQSKNLSDTVRLEAIHQVFRKKLAKQTEEALSLAEQQLALADSIANIYWKSKALNNLGLAHRRLQHFEKSLNYFNEALSLAEELNNQKGIAVVSYRMADIYFYDEAKFPEAFKYIQQSISAAEQAKEIGMLAKRYYFLAGIYRKTSEFPLAVEAFLKGIDIYEKQQDKEGLLRGYRLLANFYQHINDLEKSLTFHQKSLELSLEIEDQAGIAMAYNNIGNYYFLNKNTKAALDYYQKSLDLKLSLDDDHGIANSYQNLGNCHFKNGNIQQAEDFYQLALAIREKLGFIRDLTESYRSLGMINTERGHYQKAIDWCEKGLNLAREGKELDRSISNSECLAIAFERQGNLKKALEFQKLTTELRDSFQNAASSRELYEMEVQSQFEKERNSLLLAQQQQQTQYEGTLEKQSYLLAILLGLAVLLSLLAFLFYKNYQTKKQSNLYLNEKNQQILADKILIQNQAEQLKVRIANLSQNNKNRIASLGENPNEKAKSDIFLNKTANAQWLQQVEQIVLKTIEKQQAVKVSDLAEQLFISDRQLRRRIKQLTGLTPNKYILEIKLRKARQLLESGACKSIKEVYFRAGFQTKSYFAKVYFKRFGVLPSEEVK